MKPMFYHVCLQCCSVGGLDDLYRDAVLQTSGKNFKETVENIKGRFLELLNACGIKDADIPLFDEPSSIHSKHQTLITSFGIMSKSPSHITPQRISRHARRDPSVYADMLIEQLLAQANSLTDSDNSPPSIDVTSIHEVSYMGSEVRDHRVATDDSYIPLAPIQLSFTNTSVSLSPYVPPDQLSPAPTHQIPDSQGGYKTSHLHIPSSTGRQTPYCTTTDSGLTGSEHSPQASHIRKDSAPALPSQNRSSITPELPTSESSDSLDIKFASLFDRMDSSEVMRACRTQNFASPVLTQRVYTRQALGSSTIGSPAFPTPSSASNIRPKPSPYHDPLVVALPPQTPPRPAKHYLDRHNYNTDNYKPHLMDKNTSVESDTESARPPIPPRRPLTDSKIGRLFLQSESRELGTMWASSESKLEASTERTLRYVDSVHSSIQSEHSVHQVSYQRTLYEQSPSESVSRSASKRRKGNDRTSLPMTPSTSYQPFPTKSARQRLSFTPDSSPTRSTPSHYSPLSPSKSSTSYRMRRKKRQSPAMRKLMQDKENNSLSPVVVSSPRRKPFSDFYNIKLNYSDTTSSNSLNTSYPKSSETSPELSLPSREEELRDRDAYYCDFTLDRQHKIDTCSTKPSRSQSSADDSPYTMEDPGTGMLLVRTVEGAESSPTNFVFRPPPSDLRAPRAVARTKKRASPLKSSTQPATHRRPFYPSENVVSSSSRSRSSSSNPSSRPSSKHTSRKSISSHGSKSHPIASSTLILEPDSTSPESGSVYTWSIDEESSPCNLEKSYIRSTTVKKRPTSKTHKHQFVQERAKNLNPNDTLEISAMVSHIEIANRTSCLVGQNINSMIEDSTLGAFSNRSDSQSSIPRTSTKSSLAEKFIVAGACSFLKTLNTQVSEVYSSQSSKVSTASAMFNQAKGSIVCSSNEASEVPESSGTVYSKLISASEPNLRLHCQSEVEATHSLVPSDTDTTPEIISVLDDRPHIPGKSSTSGSSSCTAARCRPRVIHQSPAKLSQATGDSIPANSVEGEGQSHVNQDLLDSILTDSPKSVDSSGIFVPYNSYNSPVESVGTHNGYSSTVSSCVSSDTNYCTNQRGYVAPPPTPPHARLELSRHTPNNTASQTITAAAQAASPAVEPEFKRPFTPAPHVNLALRPSMRGLHTLRPATRNQGVTTLAAQQTPEKPLSVRSDPLAARSLFAVPPSVVTGPPKIKDKKSLVRKLKKFSSNFYKKTEKIQTLANL
ncbi:serine/arginine repetitive matrix protein 2-like isoform X2 [Physella acuta]|uniref:serine/arginine repetitive matrix protein 2-like isoform X2 n=1 Tax=Physella acuta TaxID=109671 RepID=UPI0027DC9C3A|nr:serine/arginine repetitive matrix protein 2-like isoform X2 [Physella acuta]